MKRAILVLNGSRLSQGELKEVFLAKEQGAFVVCADGGYANLKGKLKPDLVIGDFDSFDLSLVEQNIAKRVFAVEKDYTDGHICIEHIVSEGYDYIEIYGAMGGDRCDHFVSNLSLPPLAFSMGATAIIRGEKFDIYYFEKDFSLPCEKGKTVSVVPFTDRVHIYNSRGLKYQVDDLMLNKLHIMGISNSATDSEFSLGVSDGGVLVFVQK